MGDSIRLGARVPRYIRHALRVQAAIEQVSVGDIVNRALVAYVNAYNAQARTPVRKSLVVDDSVPVSQDPVAQRVVRDVTEALRSRPEGSADGLSR